MKGKQPQRHSTLRTADRPYSHSKVTAVQSVSQLCQLLWVMLTLQAPQESLKKRKAASEALNTAQLTVNNAYLPISLSPNGMSAVLYASFRGPQHSEVDCAQCLPAHQSQPKRHEHTAVCHLPEGITF